MASIIISDPLAPEGVELLTKRGHDARDITSLEGASRDEAVANADAWIIRSGTHIGADDFAKAGKLRAIGRAGVGVDNVDLKAATEHGVAVFNAPTGNITSAAEQAWALILAAARHVPAADAGMKDQKWLRKQLKGTELAGKTVFIVGLGRIGRMMAVRAQAFEMTCIGFDPFVTAEASAAFGVESVSLDEGFARADIITLHTPLVPATKHVVNAERLSLCKPECILVNAARGPLVDSAALVQALDAGTIQAAGIDVWETEPPEDWTLARHPKVVAAPHLGASTKEAQIKAATQACERVCDLLDTGDAGLAVNAQSTVPDALRPWAALTEALASFASQTLEGLQEIVVCATPKIDAEALKIPAASGALQSATDGPINAINAPGLAAQNGWTLATRALPDDETEYVRLHLRTTQREVVIEGTYTPHYGARVTHFDGYDVEFRPQGRFLLTRHNDVPGVLAGITSLLAQERVNVANVSLARRKSDGTAVAVIRVDGSIPRDARDGLKDLVAVTEAHRVRIR